MNKLLLLIPIYFISNIAYAEEYSTKECLQSVADVATSKNKTNTKNINTFLDALVSKKCRGNTEYSGFSNKTLFKLMGESPELLFTGIQSSSKNIKEQIHKELKQPIHDMINYPKINKSILKIKDEELRNYALKLFTPYYKEHIKHRTQWEKKNNLKWNYGS